MPRFLLISLLLCCFLSCPTRAEESFRTWTDRTGNQGHEEAAFVEIVANQVKLRTRKGRKFDLPVGRLSVDDWDYLRNTLKNNERKKELSSIPVTQKEIEENRSAFKIPNTTLTATTSSFQPGGEVKLAFDGDVETIWHSSWDEKKAYPYRIEVTFQESETVQEIHYLPRPEGDNGFVLEYEISISGDGSDWSKIHSGSFPPRSDRQIIRIPATKCRKVRFDVTKGVADLASAAEIEFYRPDIQAGQVESLFADRSFSSLKKLEKGESLQRWKTQISELKSKITRRELLEELALAELLAKTPGALKRKILMIPAKPHAATERDWKREGFCWAYFQPTGQGVLQGQPFTVYLDSGSNAEKPTLVSVNFRNYDWNDQANFTLQQGRNDFVAPKNGILYLVYSCENPEASPKPALVHFEKTTPFPFYRYGKITPQEWEKMKQEPNPISMVELCSGRVLVTMTEEVAKNHLKNPQNLCKAYEELMDVYARVLGFEKNAKPPHGIPKNLIHITEYRGDGLYATEFRTAFSSNNMYFVLDPRLVWDDSWGTWHEVGHMHQVQPYEFQNLGEVTVNIFSLEIQNQHGQKARIDTPEMKEQMKTFFSDPNRDYHKIEDVFHKLVMFWQLRLAFGDGFYPKLHRYYRDNDLPIHNDEDKVEYFIRISSKISGYDLTPFYRAWGLPPNEKTREEIQKYKPLPVPIWLNANLSDAPPNGIMTKKRR